MLRKVIAGAVVVVALAAVVFALDLGGDSPDSSSASGGPTSRVVFDADAGTKQRILNVGGLVIRASCTAYQGRKYLSVAAKTKVDNAARATVMTQHQAGQRLT